MNTVSADVSILYNLGDGSFLPESRLTTFAGPNAVTIADMDGDDALDLIIAMDEAFVSIRFNDGGGFGSFAPDMLFGAGLVPWFTAVADLNGDAALDLAVANISGDGVSVLLGLCPPPACPADLDGSGAVDFGDVLRVLGAWGQMDVPEDLDGNGGVGFGDLLIVLAAWGLCR